MLYVSGYITVAVSPVSFVVSLLATRKNTDYASESVALPSLPSDCTSDIGNGLPWRRFSASSRVAERDLVPDHLFGCADANLSKNTMLQAGSPPMACEGVLLRLPSLVLARESSKMTPNLAASHVKVI